MAQITSSTFSVGDAQIDHRVWVTESHTLDDSTEQVFIYLAEPDLDFQAIAEGRAAAMNAAASEEVP